MKDGVEYQLRKWLYELFYNGSPVEIGGLRFKLHCHEIVSREFFTRQSYSQELLSLISQAAPYFQSFIDIGANIGLITVHTSKIFKKPVLAIEPVSSNYKLLVENLQLNQLSSQVQTVKAAVGEQDGEHTIYLSKRNYGDHRLAQAHHEKRAHETIHVMTLDSIIEQASRLSPPYLIKMDVQGYECKALAGANRLLNSPCLFLSEFWPYGLSLAGDSCKCIENWRQRYDLNAYEIINEHRTYLRPISDLNEFGCAMLARGYEGSCDIVLTNMPIEKTGLTLVEHTAGVYAVL